MRAPPYTRNERATIPCRVIWVNKESISRLSGIPNEDVFRSSMCNRSSGLSLVPIVNLPIIGINSCGSRFEYTWAILDSVRTVKLFWRIGGITITMKPLKPQCPASA